MRNNYKNVIVHTCDLIQHPDYTKYFATTDNNLRCTDEYFEDMYIDIVERGIIVPIIVNANTSMVLDGAIRLKVAKRINIKEIHCLAYDLNEEQEIEMLIRQQFFIRDLSFKDKLNAADLYDHYKEYK